MSGATAAIQAQIQSGDYKAALADALATLQTAPDDAELLYMAAVCHRYLQDYAAALAMIDRLKTSVPEHGRAYQEEGHTLKSMGRAEQALRSYTMACRYNPALLASWRAMLNIYRDGGHQANAAHIATQLAYLESLPKPLIAVMDLAAQGQLLNAEALCRRFLARVPHHVEAMRLLADIGVRLGVLDDAEFLLESAVEFEPENIMARIDYIQVLRKRQKFSKALAQSSLLLETSPENPQFQSLHAIECMQSGDYDGAISMFDQVLDKLPNDPGTLTSRGYALKTHGDYEAAVESFKQACQTHPAHGEAYYALSNLKVYRFTEAELDTMIIQEQQADMPHMDRVYLCFAIGKAFEDKADYHQAFDYYQRGNDLKKRQSRYDANQITSALQEQQRLVTPALFSAKQGAGCQDPDPIFVVGLPRAGSTLIEQILASHSMVDGTMELPNIVSLAHKLGREELGYPGCLGNLSTQALQEIGEHYIEETRVHRGDAPFFIDKMPNNFRHVGLIKLILPNAKVIDARRAPMSCCFSGFKQLFAEGQEFTYSLEDIGRYYQDYVALMAHWEQVLPGFVLRVQHEALVEDLEGQVSRMLAFCELPFEEACLKYYETERDVRTPSSEQVRQPIFRTALEQWRHFDDHLDPLKLALKGVE